MSSDEFAVCKHGMTWNFGLKIGHIRGCTAFHLPQVLLHQCRTIWELLSLHAAQAPQMANKKMKLGTEQTSAVPDECVGLSYCTAHCHIYNSKVGLENWFKKEPPSLQHAHAKPSSNEKVWGAETAGNATGMYTCTCVCALSLPLWLCIGVIFVCGRVKCPWVLYPLQNPTPPDICESISWLKRKHPCPLSITPALPLHTSLPPPNNSKQPVRYCSIAAPVCPDWFKAELGEGCEPGVGLGGVMRLDVKNVVHGLLFCVFCARWMGPW